MKLVIYHPDAAARQTIRNMLERLDHVVMDEIIGLQHVVAAVAKHRPHAILLAETRLGIRPQMEFVMDRFQLAAPILWMAANLSGSDLETEIERRLSKLTTTAVFPALVPYSTDSRDVLRDDGYLPYYREQKQNVPTRSDHSRNEVAQQMAVFARQVECAVKHHAAAQRYLRQALVTDKGLRVEIAYRAVHSSYKIFWLREHIFRWVAVLAHYLPGVEPAYLTPPATPSLKLDHLFYTPPPESYYAATAVLIHGFKPNTCRSLGCL